MISAIFNRETTQNPIYRDGAEYHVTVQVDRKMEDHTDKLLIVYTINGRATLMERYMSKSFNGLPRFCPSERLAYTIGLSAARHEIEDYLRSLVYAEPRNPDEQLMAICHLIRHGTNLGKFVNAAYPSYWLKKVRIWVDNGHARFIVENALKPFSEGIELDFYFGYPHQA